MLALIKTLTTTSPSGNEGLTGRKKASFKQTHLPLLAGDHSKGTFRAPCRAGFTNSFQIGWYLTLEMSGQAAYGSVILPSELNIGSGVPAYLTRCVRQASRIE